MSPKAVVVSTALAVTLAAVPAQADAVVGSVEASAIGTSPGTFTEMSHLSFGMIRDFGLGVPAAELWLAEDVALTTADVGTTFVYSGSAVDQMRAEFADADSIDLLGWGIDPFDDGYATLFHGYMESDFAGVPSLPNAQTLAATGFDEVHVTILFYEDPIPFVDPFGNEGTQFELGTRFDFVVTSAPAPGSLALLGMAGVAGRRRRRRA